MISSKIDSQSSSTPLNVPKRISVLLSPMSFSKNIILSTRDADYAYHVEPTLAISSNNTVFVGWKDAFGHDTSGLRVSFVKSSDNGTPHST